VLLVHFQSLKKNISPVFLLDHNLSYNIIPIIRLLIDHKAKELDSQAIGLAIDTRFIRMIGTRYIDCLSELFPHEVFPHEDTPSSIQSFVQGRRKCFVAARAIVGVRKYGGNGRDVMRIIAKFVLLTRGAQIWEPC
jgi:hypothetical protein